MRFIHLHICMNSECSFFWTFIDNTMDPIRIEGLFTNISQNQYHTTSLYHFQSIHLILYHLRFLRTENAQMNKKKLALSKRLYNELLYLIFNLLYVGWTTSLPKIEISKFILHFTMFKMAAVSAIPAFFSEYYRKSDGTVEATIQGVLIIITNWNGKG